ncbi:unnamed protein product [Parnassius apollo]|uniref:(apollo) hypothetical protein n=1 Tax=Parnassius apollo TaxID=110799 RepID=A0A8S3XNU3_PARAO|nr:unnamed protein product [Parnassius apollo]
MAILQLMSMSPAKFREYTEEKFNKFDLSKTSTRNDDRQQLEWTIQKNILNEKTGFMQTFITTSAVIEKQKSPVLTEKSKLKPKAHNDIERENIEVDYNDINSGSKENIEYFSGNDTIGMVRKLKYSTTTEEILMSVHSDSDLYDVDIEQIENLKDFDLEETEYLNIFDLEDDEVVKRKNDEREAEIFNEIMRMDSENETDTKIQDKKTDIEMNLNEYGYLETQKRIEVTDKDKTEEQLQTDEELHTENKDIPNCLKKNIEKREWNIGDNVLVRYYQKKKWQYYIGLITDINDQIEKKYKTSFFKAISKKGDVIFKKPKRSDIDYIPADIIVKEVDLLQINENNEFILFNDEDLSYF